MKSFLMILTCFCCLQRTTAQDTSELPKKFTVSGYIKNLQTLTFDKSFNDLLTGNLLHNRINLKWKPIPALNVTAEFRNRLFWGEEVRKTPGFTSFLRNANEKLNLQKAWIQNNSLVLHSNVERLYVDYAVQDLNIRVGRQRINWGITSTWNPNDIFNTYNFLDVDYEERPGADGVKLQYVIGDLKTELAYTHTGKSNGDIAALKYSINKWNYDFQLITGWYKEHVTLGTGWAGSISDAGFKGEVQYFFSTKDSADHLNISLEGDYMFKKGWYLDVAGLYNKEGVTGKLPALHAFNFQFAPETFMPTRWNLIITGAKEITPILSANLSVLFAPGSNLTFVLPSVQYSLANNLDATLVWQSFFAEFDSGFQAINHRCFLRMKWSF